MFKLKLNADNLIESLTAASITKAQEVISQRVEHLKCPVHNKAAETTDWRVENGKYVYSVKACCEEFKNTVIESAAGK